MSILPINKSAIKIGAKKLLFSTVLSVALAGGAVTTAFSADSPVMELAKNGEMALKAGEFIQSIDLYSQALATPDLSDEDKGKLLAAKAEALLELGWQTRQDKPLTDAIDTYNMALDLLSAEKSPVIWAKSHSKLGDVYRSLAYGMYNQNKVDEGAKLYNQAIASFAEALTVLNKEQTPQLWAEAQRALGQVNANSDTYLEISGKASNAARLTESINAFNAALEIYTKDVDPISWAGLQFQLGDIYTTLHQRQGGSVWLGKSIQSHRKVLEVLSEKDNPSVWAQVQYFLGNGLVELGAVNKDKDMLAEAIVASKLATESNYFENIFPEFYERNLNNIKVAESLILKYKAAE